MPGGFAIRRVFTIPIPLEIQNGQEKQQRFYPPRLATLLSNLSNFLIWGIIAPGNGIRKDSFGDAIGEGA